MRSTFVMASGVVISHILSYEVWSYTGCIMITMTITRGQQVNIRSLHEQRWRNGGCTLKLVSAATAVGFLWLNVDNNAADWLVTEHVAATVRRLHGSSRKELFVPTVLLVLGWWQLSSLAACGFTPPLPSLYCVLRQFIKAPLATARAP